MRRWLVVALILAPWLVMVPTAAAVGYAVATQGSVRIPLPLGPALRVGYQRDPAPAPAAAPTPTAATPEPRLSKAWATALVQQRVNCVVKLNGGATVFFTDPIATYSPQDHEWSVVAFGIYTGPVDGSQPADATYHARWLVNDRTGAVLPQDVWDQLMRAQGCWAPPLKP